MDSNKSERNMSVAVTSEGVGRPQAPNAPRGVPIPDGELLLDARVDNLDKATEFVSDELERLGCPMRVQYQVAICLEELFVNVAHYAYGADDVGGPVRVGYTYLDPAGDIAERPGIRVQLVDEGVPFDPLDRPDIERPRTADEMEIGGLGIYMTKNIADDLTYEYIDGCNVTAFELHW